MSVLGVLCTAMKRGGCPACLPPSLHVGQHLVKILTVVLILAALEVK